MDQMDEWSDVFDFVSLEVANHMPTDIGGELRLLIRHFLHFIFPKIPYSCLVGFLEVFDRLGLAYCDQQAIGIFKGVFDCRKIFSDTHALVFAPKDSKGGLGSNVNGEKRADWRPKTGAKMTHA